MTMKTKGVLAYLLLVFGLAWSTIFVARLLLALSLENSLVQIPIAFSPAIAAVIVRGWITKEGFGDAGLALHLRRGWAFYLDGHYDHVWNHLITDSRASILRS